MGTEARLYSRAATIYYLNSRVKSSSSGAAAARATATAYVVLFGIEVLNVGKSLMHCSRLVWGHDQLTHRQTTALLVAAGMGRGRGGSGWGSSSPSAVKLIQARTHKFYVSIFSW